MRKSHLAISAAASAVALAILSPGLASAADTTATFTVTGGELAISAPPSQALSVTGDAGDQQVASGTIADITVTDARQTTGGWVASAISTDFTGGPGTVGAAGVNYVGSDVAVTGTVTATPASGNLATEVPVLNATAITGANTVTWDGEVTVTLPSDVLAGTYSGTITHSVA